MKNKVAVFGVFTSLALILSYVELLIPINFGIPGMKLGLANLLVVILLYKGCPRDALLLSVIRILLSGLIFGNMFSIFYSLGGGLLSLAVMVFLKKTGQFTVAGISIGGGASHNVGQLLVAMFVVQTYQVGYYLPVLLIPGSAFQQSFFRFPVWRRLPWHLRKVLQTAIHQEKGRTKYLILLLDQCHSHRSEDGIHSDPLWSEIQTVA